MDLKEWLLGIKVLAAASAAAAAAAAAAATAKGTVPAQHVARVSGVLKGFGFSLVLSIMQSIEAVNTVHPTPP